MEIFIGNVRHQQAFVGMAGKYVGRFDGVLGNPYVIGRDGTRDEVIAQYRVRLWQEIQARSVVWEALRGLVQMQEDVVLLCHCAPKRCHAEVIKAAVQWLRTQQ